MFLRTPLNECFCKYIKHQWFQLWQESDDFLNLLSLLATFYSLLAHHSFTFSFFQNHWHFFYFFSFLKSKVHSQAKCHKPKWNSKILLFLLLVAMFGSMIHYQMLKNNYLRPKICWTENDKMTIFRLLSYQKSDY